MSGVQTSLALQDRLSGPLMKMMRALDSTVRVMERMDSTASNLDTRGLQRARRDIQSATADMERLRSSTSVPDRLGGGFTRMQGPVNRASGAVRNFFAGFAGAAAAYLSIQGLTNGFKKFIEASDTYVSTSARLSNINDGLQTQVELQDKIYNAAQRSRGAYVGMADSVAKLNLLAGDAFASNDEAIRFSELMGKSFTISGAGTSEKQAGMHQLTQAMASGRLQGDEFVSITENAPLLAHAIADAMKVSMGELKKLSSEGAITADIIKGALFGAADDIEGKFKAMPMTFGQSMTAMKNWALFAFEPLLKRFNDFVNSDAFTVLAGHVMWFVNVFIAGMTLMFDVLETIYNEVGAIGQMLSDSWSVVGPVILVAAAALGTYLAILAAYRTVLLLAAGAKAFLTLQTAIHGAAMAFATGATFMATAAQHGLNAAILAFPGTWILLAFVAVIALVIYAFIAWGDTMAKVIGAIVGYFYFMWAAYYNIAMAIGNLSLAVAEWFVNTWNQAVYLVQMGWIAFNLVARAMLDAVGNAAISVAEFFVNSWNQALYMVHLGWIALNMGARIVLDAIGNAAITIAEIFMNTWNNAVFGVQTAFHAMGSFIGTIMSGVASGTVGVVNSALSAISTLINGAAAGINVMIGLINNIPGVNIGTVGTVDLKLGAGISDFAANIGKNLVAPVKAANVSLAKMNTAGDYANSVNIPSAPAKANFGSMNTSGDYLGGVTMPTAPTGSADFGRLDYKDMGAAFAKGQEIGSNLSLKASAGLNSVVDKVSGFLKGAPTEKGNPLVPGNIPMGDLAGAGNPLGGGNDKLAKGNGKGKNPTGGKLDSIGKIEKEINIAEEDLKMLRDLAERKSIQNFVTLTPSVTFSGDMSVKEEADIDKIVRKITKVFEDDISRSAEGVYA